MTNVAPPKIALDSFAPSFLRVYVFTAPKIALDYFAPSLLQGYVFTPPKIVLDSSYCLLRVYMCINYM